MTETATVTWSTDESLLVKAALRTAGERDTDIDDAMRRYSEALGMHVAFAGGTEEFHENPPSPTNLLGNFGDSDRTWTGTRTEFEALQTVITTFVVDNMQARQPIHEHIGEIEGIHEKINDAYEQLGGEVE